MLTKILFTVIVIVIVLLVYQTRFRPVARTVQKIRARRFEFRQAIQMGDLQCRIRIGAGIGRGLLLQMAC